MQLETPIATNISLQG